MSSVRRHLMIAAALPCLAIAFAGPALAQQPTKPAASAPGAAAKPTAVSAKPSTTTGSIKGRVVHGNDGLPYANVTVLGTKIGTMTDENGNFVIPVVPVGSVQVKAQALGYEAQVQTVQVNAGVSSSVTFTVGESKPVTEVEEIVVTAEKRIDTKSSTTKQTISTFGGVATKTFYQDAAAPSVIVSAADVYVSDFSKLAVIPNRFIRQVSSNYNDCFILDWDLLAVGFLREFQVQELAKTGDAEKRQLIVEWSLVVKNDKGMGIVGDLNN